jgi:(+)-neomenthol dehydrogenase
MKKKGKDKEEKKAKEEKKPADPRKIVLITGASRGIGYCLVEKILANKKNLRIIMTCRDEEKGQQLYKELCEKYPEDVERFFYHQLDITDEASITALIDFIKKSFKKFDYLVNNAGYSSTGRDFNEQVCEDTFKVNFNGTINFTEKLFGTFNKNGKIIFVTSKSGTLSKLKNENLISKFKNAKNVDDVLKLSEKFKKTIPEEKTEADGWYKNCFAMSKLFLNFYAKLIIKKREVSRESISVYAMHPGWCKTDMGGQYAPLEVGEGADRILFLLELPDTVNKDYQGKFFDENKVVAFD